MGEEVKMSEYERSGGGCDDDRVLEWEMGLPSGEDLTPLSQSLISTELVSAFSISLEPARTIQDVDRASQRTLSALCDGSHASLSNNHGAAVEGVEDRVGSSCAGSDPKKMKKSDDGGAEAAAMVEEADSGTENSSAKTVKRPRLVWTPQLHKRFVEVVAHLGIKNAVPKTIMQLMNVEGLTRENVASHLQKYRLYLKRMQGGLPTEGPPSSDQLFSSTPVPPQSFQKGSGGGVQANGGGGGHVCVPIPVPYAAGAPPPPMMPMPVYGHLGLQGYHHHHHQHHYTHNHYHQNHHHHSGGVGGFESNPYMMQQGDWPGNKHGSVPPYPPVGGGGANEK